MAAMSRLTDFLLEACDLVKTFLEVTVGIALSHRIIVTREGQISGEINPGITSQDFYV